jgi:hypothetical protein
MTPRIRLTSPPADAANYAQIKRDEPLFHSEAVASRPVEGVRNLFEVYATE